MKRALLLFISAALLAGLSACSRDVKNNPSDNETQVALLIEQASDDVTSQRFDAAMEKALRALDLAGEDPLLKVQALESIIGVDIMASRDEDAWNKALEAESIARENGFRKELSAILVFKAKLCSYAEISPETGRNDEGLEYATEALALAEETGALEHLYTILPLPLNCQRPWREHRIREGWR